ncbi:MAG: sugar phosphate isomerase/epimerase family protein [Bacillota bacterium]
MKLGCAVATYETRFGPIVFKDGDLKENVKMMQKYGYQSMDLFVKKTTPDQIKEYKNIITSAGLEVSTLLAIFLAESGVKLSETDPKLRQRNVDLMKEQLDNAKLIGAKGLALGFIRGMHGENETESDGLKRIAEALHEIGGYADEIGSSIMLEPVNRYEINTLNRGWDAVDFIKNYDLKGVSLLLDMFHMNIEDDDIFETIRYAKDYIANLHISSSNRYAVGQGHFDYGKVVDVLREIGYDSYMTLECFSTDKEETLRQTMEHMKQFI